MVPGPFESKSQPASPPCTLDGKLAKNQPAVSTSQACRKNTQLCRKLTIGSGNRSCRQNEFWLYAKSSMHSSRSGFIPGVATPIHGPSSGEDRSRKGDLALIEVIQHDPSEFCGICPEHAWERQEIHVNNGTTSHSHKKSRFWKSNETRWNPIPAKPRRPSISGSASASAMATL